MQLNYKTFGNGPPLVILHGLFGSLDNWVSLARRFSEHFSVFILDARNHGKSPRSSEFNYPAMADDLLEFLDSQGIHRSHLLGHSMGGKTVMRFCLDHSERTEKLIVADMPPIALPSSHQEIFDALQSLPLASIKTRNEAESWLAEKIKDTPTRLFILKSLDRTSDNRFEWKFNLDDIQKNYNEILTEIDSTEAVSNPGLFLRGENSNYVTEKAFPPIHRLFPNSKIETIAKAGHWLHAEAPEAFLQSCLRFLQD